LAGKPANEVTARDIASLLRPLVEEGKGRTAGKLRSYLHAAFVWAARAELDPDAPADFLPFRVEQNPVSGTATLSKYNRARERALSEPELREYYSAIKALPDSAIRDATLLMILLGGQRIAQLIRARTIDVDDNAGTLRLLDPKGRRTQPRSHVLPLSRPAMAVVERCLVRVEAQQKQARMKGGAPLMGFLFSTHGDVPIRPESVSKATFEIVRKLLSKPEEERVIHELFRLGDIRRTCETRLAALGMSVDLRGQIQSHGLSGVQARHYDKHDYLKEKLAALTSWADWLEQRLASKVLPIRKGERNE
jgi:integrase